MPSFVAFLGFLLPLVSVALGLDAINGEYNSSHALARPVATDLPGRAAHRQISRRTPRHRDLPHHAVAARHRARHPASRPAAERRGDPARARLPLASFVYAGVWLAVALVFSTLFRAPATSALAALTVWLLFAIFWSMLAPLIASSAIPIDPLNPITAVHQIQLENAIGRISPNVLYGEMTLALLNPATRSLGLVFPGQLQQAVMGAPLPVSQSLMLIWPQLAGMLAALLVLFTLTYVSFQRQEIRA